ncbi:rare lipoprotein A [Nitratiruptor sp. YY08-14]|nr:MULTISPECIES: septal ring lytic transglycosylase RlpA family protein [unclassified Nitratiruptor]BCD60503.1 rare lipoprotein A [Nitratiruptor sp. YY08-10]BCD64008.1 rare lipoprotein A [Nitratiruptor sp. YY08-14]
MSFIIKYLFFFIFMLLFAGCGESVSNLSYTTYHTSYGKINNSPSVHRATMRPYVVNGVRYYPTVVEVGTKYRGIASWYGPNFHGKKTSNGETYNMYEYTAAHKTLPMNTMVRVTNLNNGKSTVVRINDRGPFVGNRIIDLSYSAAKKIDMIKTGTAPVELEVLGFGGKVENLPGIPKRKVVLNNFAVQIGSFRRYQGAKITRDRNILVQGRYKAVIKKFYVDGLPLYRVWLTGFRSEKEARDFIAQGLYPGAFIIRNGND